MTVVSNTSPITNLAGIGYLALLKDLYGTITIPVGVFNEMARIGKVVPGALEVQTLPWINSCEVQDLDRVRELRSVLDLGEAEAIALALELSTELLLLDERPGRQLAQQFGLSVTGVLGVLLEAKAKQLIGQVKPLMEQLVSDMNFRIGQPLYQGVLELADEV
ncbi:MAG: DUF3368 domain-containing protein [Leptolyngbya sp. SIOISBB]|nr:DUF3368 domain-containing protein [Leptolyngbya sp. SIOISBB]